MALRATNFITMIESWWTGRSRILIVASRAPLLLTSHANDCNWISATPILLSTGQDERRSRTGEKN